MESSVDFSMPWLVDFNFQHSFKKWLRFNNPGQRTHTINEAVRSFTARTLFFGRYLQPASLADGPVPRFVSMLALRTCI
jgi:hypothetical protein